VQPVHPETIADGIAVGAPISAALVLRDMRESGGGFVAVSDEAMLEAIRTLGATSGLLAEPALEAGLIGRDETIVVHVTGTGLKNPRYLQPKSQSTEVSAALEEVERALKMT
jgi:threonine synthase